MREWLLEVKMSEFPYILIEKCLYSMCETVICLVTVPIVEESRGLEVTSVTAMEVTSIVFLFHNNQWRTWCIVVQLNEPVHSLLRIDEAITAALHVVFHIPCRVRSSKQLWRWTSFNGTSSVHGRTNLWRTLRIINGYIYFVLIGLSIDNPWTNIGLVLFLNTINYYYTINEYCE